MSQKTTEKPAKEESKAEEENNIVVREVASLITEKFIAEEVYDPPHLPEFAVYNFDKQTFEFKKEIDLGEHDSKGRKILYFPIFNDHLKKGMVILPRKPVECTIEDTIKESINLVLSGFDPCSVENGLKLLVLGQIAGWFIDEERPSLPIVIAGIGVFAPIYAIRGPSGSGKNRLANLLRLLSYHPFFDVSTYRIPSLYRPLDIWKGTLVIDEGDLASTKEDSEFIHFLNSRATGTPIGRQNPDKPSKCDAFDSFGITIISQRRNFEDNATEGRTIPFSADVSEKRLPTLETDEMIRKGFELQDKLLYMRMKYWKDIKIDKTLWIEGVTDARFNSSLLPIMTLAKFVPWLSEFINSIIEPMEKERRKLKAQSDDGQLVNFLWEKIESGSWGIHNNLYYVGESKEVIKDIGGEEDTVVKPLTVSEIAEKFRYSAKRIRTLVISLNITPKDAPNLVRIGKHNYRPIWFDPEKFEKRLREFVVDYEKNTLFKEFGLPVVEIEVETKKK